MSAEFNKFKEYFSLSDGDTFEQKEKQLVASILKARKKARELEEADHLTTLIERTRDAIDKYFSWSESWIEEHTALSSVADSEEGVMEKKKLRELRRAFEDKFKDYVALDFELAHNLRIATDFQMREEEGMDVIPKTEWTPDTETFLDTYLKKVPAMKEDIDRLKEALSFLEALGARLDKIEKDLQGFFGKKTGRTLFSSYSSGLRMANENKIGSAIGKTKRTRAGLVSVVTGGKKDTLIRQMQALKEEYLNHMAMLKISDERIYLRTGEVKIALDVARKELKQAQDLLKKYHYPFLKSRVRALKTLEDRLHTVGSLESLLIIYRYATKGLTLTLSRFEDTRMIESVVTGPLDYLVHHKIKELSYIKENTDKIMSGLQRAIHNRLAQLA